jgi:hypothetical protein
MGTRYYIGDRGKVYVADLEQLQRAVQAGLFSAKAVIMPVPEHSAEGMAARAADEVRAWGEGILGHRARGLRTDGDVPGQGEQRFATKRGDGHQERTAQADENTSRNHSTGASSAELELKMTMAGIDLELALLHLSREVAFAENIQRVDDVLAQIDEKVRRGW